MSSTPSAASAGNAVRAAGNSEWLEVVARIGYVVDGVLHLLIGVIVLRLALGGGSGQEASPTGALTQLSSSGFGTFALWVTVIAFVALGIWQAVNAAAGVGAARRPPRGRQPHR